MSRPKSDKSWIKLNCKLCNIEFTVRRSKPKVYCSKKCSNSDPDIKNKIKATQTETFNNKYGMHPMQTMETRERLKDSLIKKYGVSHYSQHTDHRKKVESTLHTKYGASNYNNIEQIKKTNIEKYGVDNYTKTSEYKEKYKKTCIKKYGLPHYSLTPNYKDSHKLLMFNKFIKHDRFSNFTPKFTMEEYCGVTPKFNKKYPFQCNRCSIITECFIDDGKPPKCNKCDSTNVSSFQEEIYSFISNELSISCKLNDREIISPKELDIFIPDKKYAIECNGIYWHSEVLGKKNKIYHLNKTINCLKKGINLIHVFENDWYSKKEIVKSIIRNILHCNVNKIGGRKCEVKEITKQQCKKFLDENHLQGNDHSAVKYGLYYNTELVSVMTFCKSRFDKKYQWELSRYCNKTNYSIQGAANKLFSYFIEKHAPISVVSYSDRKIFNGSIYSNMGFRFINHTPPNYYYIIDNYKTLKSRMGFQKHKLKTMLPLFDSTKSEWENMKNHGFDRIWDCGNSKWVYNNPNIIV